MITQYNIYLQNVKNSQLQIQNGNILEWLPANKIKNIVLHVRRVFYVI